MADSYEVVSAFYINGKEIVFGIDDNKDFSYLVSDCSFNEVFGRYYSNAISYNSYLEALSEFTTRVSTEVEKAVSIAHELGIADTLTIDDCVEDSRLGNYEGEVVVINSKVLQRDKRTADYQLGIATGGFGCNAEERTSGFLQRTLFR